MFTTAGQTEMEAEEELVRRRSQEVVDRCCFSVRKSAGCDSFRQRSWMCEAAASQLGAAGSAHSRGGQAGMWTKSRASVFLSPRWIKHAASMRSASSPPTSGTTNLHFDVDTIGERSRKLCEHSGVGFLGGPGTRPAGGRGRVPVGGMIHRE